MGNSKVFLMQYLMKTFEKCSKYFEVLVLKNLKNFCCGKYNGKLAWPEFFFWYRVLTAELLYHLGIFHVQKQLTFRSYFHNYLENALEQYELFLLPSSKLYSGNSVSTLADSQGLPSIHLSKRTHYWGIFNNLVKINVHFHHPEV